jgi:hypothetical protein
VCGGRKRELRREGIKEGWKQENKEREEHKQHP